jgi:hypothetical protein
VIINKLWRLWRRLVTFFLMTSNRALSMKFTWNQNKHAVVRFVGYAAHDIPGRYVTGIYLSRSDCSQRTNKSVRCLSCSASMQSDFRLFGPCFPFVCPVHAGCKWSKRHSVRRKSCSNRVQPQEMGRSCCQAPPVSFRQISLCYRGHSCLSSGVARAFSGGSVIWIPITCWCD